jgi:hypothetical protein
MPALTPLLIPPRTLPTCPQAPSSRGRPSSTPTRTPWTWRRTWTTWRRTWGRYAARARRAPSTSGCTIWSRWTWARWRWWRRSSATRPRWARCLVVIGLALALVVLLAGVVHAVMTRCCRVALDSGQSRGTSCSRRYCATAGVERHAGVWPAQRDVDLHGHHGRQRHSAAVGGGHPAAGGRVRGPRVQGGQGCQGRGWLLGLAGPAAALLHGVA